MDILIAEEDNIVSLEEALAFIDDYGMHDENFTDTLAGLVPVHNSPVDLFSQISPSELLTPKPDVKTRPTKKRTKLQRKPSKSSSSHDEKGTKRQRTRSASSSSTRLQQRKRAELQALREQAQELETQVELLKKNKFLPGGVALELDADMLTSDESNLKTPTNWQEMAIAQYKDRLMSEKTNRRLKSILANQERVNGALSGLLQKRSVLNGMDYVLSAQIGADTALLPIENTFDETLPDTSKTILTELEERVQCLYKTFKSKSTTTTQSPAISCDMKIQLDAKRGKMIEFITSTPMSCSEDEASEILWKELTTYRDYLDKTYKYMKAAKPNTHEKNFVMTLRSPSGMVELNGLQFMQRFEEQDRTVYIVAERMTQSTKGVQFRDEGWMTVTPSKTRPNTSVVEIYLQLYMECDDNLEASPEDVAYARNTVMGILSNAFRKFFQTQQNTLLEKAGRATMPSVPIPSIVV